MLSCCLLACCRGEEDENNLTNQINGLSNAQLQSRTAMYKTNIGVMRYEIEKLRYDKQQVEADLKDNQEKVKMHKQLPYLVANVVEVRPTLFKQITVKHIYSLFPNF